MPNIFLLDYHTRLKIWSELRVKLQDLPVLDQCVETDKFWQSAPLVNHYLHTDYMREWPNPWQLLSDNNYCYYGRALGMIYTLLLLGNKDIELLDAIDHNNEVVLVLVNNQYILNYWPETVLDNKLSDFTIKTRISIVELENKIK